MGVKVWNKTALNSNSEATKNRLSSLEQVSLNCTIPKVKVGENNSVYLSEENEIHACLNCLP